ncbi:HAD domain-containing protein [Paraburkholderia sediminicola]|uniref:HAD domain-containing protein n=1 Tax=Paraburkholderia sediminicola TaxID=458836 RepID=UPI0038BAB16F
MNTDNWVLGLHPTAPTLLLAFGGVMHVGHGLLHDDGRVSLDSGRPLFQYAPYLVDVLSPWPGAQIILTTSWLSTLGAERIVQMLPFELRRRVVGNTLATPPRFGEIRDGTARTGVAIRHALRLGLQRWLVVDDELYGIPPQCAHRFLRTSPESALGAPETRKQLEAWLAANGKA